MRTGSAKPSIAMRAFCSFVFTGPFAGGGFLRGAIARPAAPLALRRAIEHGNRGQTEGLQRFDVQSFGDDFEIEAAGLAENIFAFELGRLFPERDGGLVERDGVRFD